MALTKEQKKRVFETLKEKIAQQKAMVFINFKGLKIKDLFELRSKLKKKGAQFLVAKKTLMRLAFEEKSIKVDLQKMEGQLALIFGFQDELSPAKIAYQFSQQNENLKILGGFIESQKKEFLSSDAIITLGQLPSQEELLSRLVGSISAPILNLVNVLEGNIKGLIYVLAKAKT